MVCVIKVSLPDISGCFSPQGENSGPINEIKNSERIITRPTIESFERKNLFNTVIPGERDLTLSPRFSPCKSSSAETVSETTGVSSTAAGSVITSTVFSTVSGCKSLFFLSISLSPYFPSLTRGSTTTYIKSVSSMPMTVSAAMNIS